MSWIPAYGIDKSMQILTTHPFIGATLSRVGLQFWNPTIDGKSIQLAPKNETGQSVEKRQVKQVVAWLKARKIKVLLTVYNNSQLTKKWDWELARRAFRDNPSEFIDALVKNVHEYGLDGVDLDLEGEGEFDSDRIAYADFVRRLGLKLRNNGKLLTVDSFHSPCANAPNMSWWSDWKDYVDTIHSMGYQDLFEASTVSFRPEGKLACEGGAAIFKYSWQLSYAERAGFRKDQILMGMPTWMAKWGEGGTGTDISSHLSDASKLGVGVALWDLQLAAPGWRNARIWREMKALTQLHQRKANQRVK
ncbi:glycosyl hydrolase family 18 protein [Undibacterium fentianense]|uniref:GH18 domain-containing protein n=1 Tax=Undibacterium fentianense TaxID=2828728 RepID=A0A941IC18_9BURK|nr:glycosyl hydrolase family 18 protein [Undibacterium fentianense]MBR7799714.1 hypothetical protein [Undibacterium fentianense]